MRISVSFFILLCFLFIAKLFSADESGDTISVQDVSPPFQMTQRPFSPFAIRCDDNELAITLLGESSIRGEKEIDDISVLFQLDNSTGFPYLTEVFKNTNNTFAQTNILQPEPIRKFCIITKIPANTNNSSFENITTWLQKFQQPQCIYEGCPCITIIGELSDGRKIEVDFAQKNNSEYVYYPLQRDKIFYKNESNQIRIFCKMRLSNNIFGFHDELIKSFDLNDSRDNSIINGQIFYDGSNIYDKISFPAWLNEWTHDQLTSSDKERLKIWSLFKDEQRNCVAINPNSVNNQNPIPVGCYISRGTAYPKRIAAIYSGGNNAVCFLVECLMQKWDSVTLPITSYEVEIFLNTKISVLFDDSAVCVGRRNQNNAWEEGVYICNSQPSDRSQVWERKYSQHGRQNYTLISDAMKFFGDFKKPQEMTDDSVYVNHLSYFPLLLRVNLPYAQASLNPHLSRMENLVRLNITREKSLRFEELSSNRQKEMYSFYGEREAPNLTYQFLLNPEFDMPQLIGIIGQLKKLQKLVIKAPMAYVDVNNAASEVKKIAMTLKNMTELKKLVLPIPPVRNYAMSLINRSGTTLGKVALATSTTVAVSSTVATTTAATATAATAAASSAAAAAATATNVATATKVCAFLLSPLLGGPLFSAPIVAATAPIVAATAATATTATTAAATAAATAATATATAATAATAASLAVTGAGILAGTVSVGLLGSCLRDGGNWMAGNSYDEHLAFARILGESQSLESLELYGVCDDYDRKNIQAAFNEGRAAIRKKNFTIKWLSLPKIL